MTENESKRETTKIRHELVVAEFERLLSKREVILGKTYRVYDYKLCLAKAGVKFGFSERTVENIVNGWS